MSAPQGSDIFAEVKLIQRFSETYRKKLNPLITGLNGNLRQSPNPQAIRLCIEAVDMMLLTQRQLASAIADLTSRLK